MTRNSIINRIGPAHLTSNLEADEYSYVQAAKQKGRNLESLLGYMPKHFKLDLRFEKEDTVILIETKQNFTDADIPQLDQYLQNERAVHGSKKIICILANTSDNRIRVWKNSIDPEHELRDETVLDSIDHYQSLFQLRKENNREKVLKNTYALNELLHKKDIDEKLRSQFVGTVLLHIKDLAQQEGIADYKELLEAIKKSLSSQSASKIRTGIGDTLLALLEGDTSGHKAKKIDLLQKSVLENQKVKALTTTDWLEIIEAILMGIHQYIDPNSSEGQDILNLFFIAFNKYTGKADKNQAFTPDHITEFMCCITEVDHTKRVFDGTCGSASFLVQAMVKELADCRKGNTEARAKELQDTVKRDHIYGIEVEEKAYGLAVTNMLIHGDGNSNIQFGSCFSPENRKFIKETAKPDIILINPPYNSKPLTIPDSYKGKWGNAVNGKEDPTKGLVFVRYFSDVIKEMNQELETPKTVKLAVLLPLACAIGTSSIIASEKAALLEDNTLEAVFSLPAEIFYPGASVCACCMLFTLGQPHVKPDGTVRSTFFGYCKEDGFVKKKNLGRVEQFDPNGKSKWKKLESEWLYLFNNHKEEAGKSAVRQVTADDEWLCEAYMKTDYSKLSERDFQQTLNNYLSYQVKEGNITVRRDD